MFFGVKKFWRKKRFGVKKFWRKNAFFGVKTVFWRKRVLPLKLDNGTVFYVCQFSISIAARG